MMLSASQRGALLRIVWLLAVTFSAASGSIAQTVGSISGKITDDRTKDGLPYANIVIRGTTMGAASDIMGNYFIDKVPPGVYTLIVSVVGYTTKEVGNIRVDVGTVSKVDLALSPTTIQIGELQVYGASLRRERITEAPAAVTVIEARDFRLNGSHSQLPKMLENEPGVDIVQSGLYDFNINTRGFNSSLTRRLLVLLDGRDLAIVFLGAQEWNGLSVPVEDLGRIELVRGPGSALYGANAFNGVINIVTPPPKDIVGTKVTLAAGELNAFRGDIRHANTSGPWGYKVNFGRFQGDTWSQSRIQLPFEYSGFNPFLNTEVAPVNKKKVASTYGSARVDYDFVDGSFVTAEGGLSQVENEIYVTGIGRVQVRRAQKPWGRVAYTTNDFSIQVWANGRNSKKPQYSLSTGLPLHEQSATYQADFQYRFTTAEEKLFVVAGASYRYQTIDTKGTLMLASRKDNMTGINAQLEYRFSQRLKAVAAARWDRSTLHPSQISPKAAVVWAPDPYHTFRATYNRAFQAPNYSELFLHVLHPFRALAYLGNDDLTVEKINGYEYGYKGILSNSLYVTFDAYYNRLSDFITDLGPGLNPKYRGQENIGGTLRTVWSYTNAGRVDEKGFEASVNYYLSDEWLLSSNYAYFDFKVLEEEADDPLVPNAPRHKVNGGITYTNPSGFEANVRVKYVPSYRWSAGIYRGDILAYALVDVAARYEVNQNLSIGLSVANLFDREHYQIFGGSLLGRRAIASLTATF